MIKVLDLTCILLINLTLFSPSTTSSLDQLVLNLWWQWTLLWGKAPCTEIGVAFPCILFVSCRNQGNDRKAKESCCFPYLMFVRFYKLWGKENSRKLRKIWPNFPPYGKSQERKMDLLKLSFILLLPLSNDILNEFWHPHSLFGPEQMSENFKFLFHTRDGLNTVGRTS